MISLPGDAVSHPDGDFATVGLPGPLPGPSPWLFQSFYQTKIPMQSLPAELVPRHLPESLGSTWKRLLPVWSNSLPQ